MRGLEDREYEKGFYNLVVAISGGLFVSIAIDQLNATLFGQGKFNFFASQRTQTSSAFLNGFDVIHDLRDHDTLLFGKIFTGDTGKGDGLVDTSLDGFRVGNLDGNINGRDNRYIVSSFLSYLFAVFSVSTVSTISMMSMVSVSLMSRLADSDHLDLSFFPEGNLDSLGSGVFILLLVSVSTDFLRNLLNGFSADSASDNVTHFFVNNALDG